MRNGVIILTQLAIDLGHSSLTRGMSKVGIWKLQWRTLHHRCRRRSDGKQNRATLIGAQDLGLALTPRLDRRHRRMAEGIVTA